MYWLFDSPQAGNKIIHLTVGLNDLKSGMSLRSSSNKSKFDSCLSKYEVDVRKVWVSVRRDPSPIYTQPNGMLTHALC